MTEILDLIRKRKWDTLIIGGLVAIAIITIPISVKYTMDKSFKENLTPIYNSIQKIEHRQVDEIIDRGIAAYKKIYELSQLESSTQNATSIKIALRTPEARDILFQIDRERTLLFEQYFGDN